MVNLKVSSRILVVVLGHPLLGHHLVVPEHVLPKEVLGLEELVAFLAVERGSEGDDD